MTHIERTDTNSAMVDGDIVPYEPSQHGDIKENADIVAGSIAAKLIPVHEQFSERIARLKTEQESFEQKLSDLVDKRSFSYARARKHLEAGNVVDPSDELSKLEHDYQTRINSVSIEALQSAKLAEELAHLRRTIFDEEALLKAENELIAHHRAAAAIKRRVA